MEEVQPQSFKARKLTEDTKKIIETLKEIDRVCPRHNTGLGYYANELVCYKCHIEQLVEEGKACRRHWNEYIQYGYGQEKCPACEREYNRKSPDWQGGTALRRVDAAIPTANFINARNSRSLPVLSDEKARLAVKTVVKEIGKPFKSATGPTGNGKKYNHRVVIWKVDLDQGILTSNALVEAGISDFKITNDGWLTIWIPKTLTVREIVKKPNEIP